MVRAPRSTPGQRAAARTVCTRTRTTTTVTTVLYRVIDATALGELRGRSPRSVVVNADRRRRQYETGRTDVDPCGWPPGPPLNRWLFSCDLIGDVDIPTSMILWLPMPDYPFAGRPVGWAAPDESAAGVDALGERHVNEMLVASQRVRDAAVAEADALRMALQASTDSPLVQELRGEISRLRRAVAAMVAPTDG